MFKAQLFIGFAIDETLANEFRTVDSKLWALFVQESDSYLKQIEHQGTQFLGKFADCITDISALEQLQSNIYSLLSRLYPDYPYQNYPLWVLPVLEKTA